jgi:hypothetical protein
MFDTFVSKPVLKRLSSGSRNFEKNVVETLGCFGWVGKVGVVVVFNKCPNTVLYIQGMTVGTSGACYAW